MLFNSLEFLIFLPIVFTLYWFVFKSLKWQNLLILIASYVFYGWWNWRFLLLIALTSFSSFISGLLIFQYKNRKWQKIISAVNIVFNLGILATFKYFNFFSENIQLLFHSLGYELDSVTLDVILPVGISFYTFQALSYSIDVYQKKIPACKNIISFFSYISFFPQLVAGPIERATNLLPQFYKSRIFNYQQSVDGCRQILWGLFKKMVVADNCAAIVNSIWDTYQDQTGFTLLLGGFFFTFQIYGDFSGYSDIAIGTAKLFGFKLMNNFELPYFSRDIAEFWRKWHISLNTWFRDYVYIPIGGSHVSKRLIIRNVFIVFLTSGFWHGANWTFILWGAYHACLFIPLILGQKNKRYKEIVASTKNLPSVKEFFQMLITFILVMFGWIIFRSNNLQQLFHYLSILLSKSIFDVDLTFVSKSTLFFILILVGVEWMQRKRRYVLEFASEGIFKNCVLRYIIYYIIIILVIGFSGMNQTFIYFQF